MEAGQSVGAKKYSQSLEVGKDKERISLLKNSLEFSSGNTLILDL